MTEDVIGDTTDKAEEKQYFPPTMPCLAIADLVHSIIGESKEKRSNVLDQLGYQNKEKAARRFDAMLETGVTCPNLEKYLPEALGVEAEVFLRAIEESSLQIAEHQKAIDGYEEALRCSSFEPHIFVEIAYKNRPRSLFASWGYNVKELRHIEVPADLLLETQMVQIEEVGRLIQEFEGSERYEAGVRLFSGPESYTYYPSYKQGWKFTVGGGFVGRF